MNKVLLIAFATILILIGGFYALNAYIYHEKQGPNEAVQTYEPYRATLTGTYVCLPHVDQTGPQTEECAYGIQTEAGEYYAIDLNLMSQTPPPFQSGDEFTAQGVITPIERLSTDEWRKYPIVGIFSITDSVVKETAPQEPTETEEPYACTADALICPDGSAVGRTGPNCEFEACPSSEATTSRVTTFISGTAAALTVSVSPQEIVSDSRCPKEVTCVWAGTVEVRTTLTTPVSHGEHVLTLGKPQVFGDHTVTLVEVTPLKTQVTIPESSYRFTFEVSKV